MIPDMLIHLPGASGKKRIFSSGEYSKFREKIHNIHIRIWESGVARYRDGRLSIEIKLEAIQSRDGQLCNVECLKGQ